MSKEDFDNFHKQVLNMPRDSFSDFNLDKLRSLVEYLNLIKIDIGPEGCNIDELYINFHFALKDNVLLNPNKRFDSLFDLSITEIEDIKKHYKIKGRFFRHWMQLAKLLDLLTHPNSDSTRRSKVIVSNFNDELIESNRTLFSLLIRDKVLSINVKDNSLIRDLDSFDYYKDLSFRPAIGILYYLFLLKRPATKFELSIFFGRPDKDLQDEINIINSAYNLGKKFDLDMKQQEASFFIMKDWVDNKGELLKYGSSQQSYFKFNSFFILMETVGLIKIKEGLVSLTDYSKKLVNDYNEIEYLQLQEIENQIEDESDDIQNTLIENRTEYVLRLLSKDKNFKDRINKRSAERDTIIRKITRISRKRDLILPVIAKIEANFKCKACSKETFLGKDGYNHVEAHHILEFNNIEKGPDVIENLLVLCPNCHALVHNAPQNTINHFYSKLRERNILSRDQFEKLLKDELISKKQIKLLLEKGIISKEEYKLFLKID